MKLIKIHLPSCQQWYYRQKGQFFTLREVYVDQYPVLKDYVPSLVIRLTDQQLILKLVRARHWVEYVKMLWRHSRISKEINGNELMRRCGVAVPAIVESGIGIFPAKGYQFLGYYLMEDLSCQGLQNSREMFLQNALSPEVRWTFLQNVVSDVQKMLAQRIVFNDFKLENIFLDAQGNSVWIDTGVSRYPFFQNKKLHKKHNRAVSYFLEHHESLLTDNENQLIRSLFL